jgi:elongation factor P--(R)-beta-lysine ligase
MNIRWDYLHARADLLDRLRAFFHDRGFLEVETPTLLSEAIPERHIENFVVSRLAGYSPQGGGATYYLQASPELAMKRLLAAGSGPIFQVCKAYRAEELGALHNAEFTMVEWYRPGDDCRAGMDLLDELAYTLTGFSCRRTTYREAFQGTLGIDPHTALIEDLRESTDDPPELGDERDEWLNYLLATQVEPTLGAGGPELLYHYPASQAALATTVQDDFAVPVAERFELYWRGVELANGYHELAEAAELRRRLVLENEQIAAQGRTTVALPESLLAAMESPGLPPCAGVALGFDRLVMLCVGADSIHDVRTY